MTTRAKLKIALAIAALAFLFNLPGIVTWRSFWVADESRYAEVLREMMADGHWIVPHLNGTFYSDKPPLYFWLAAIPSLLKGSITPFSFLIVTWLGTAGFLATTWFWAQSLYGRKVAWLSVWLMSSSLLCVVCAQIVRMDMLMAFLSALSLYCFHIGYQSRRPVFYGAFYALAGLAVMTKGPLGIIFPLLPAVALLLRHRQWAELRRLLVHWGWIPFAAMTGGWLLAARWVGPPEFLQNMFGEQIVARAAGKSIHALPYFFYVLVLPVVCLPWSVLFPAAFRDSRKRGERMDELLLWWAACGFVVISLIKGKLFIYLLPILPPVMIMVGRALAGLWDSSAPMERRHVIAGCTGVILTFLAPAVMPWVAPHIPQTANLNLWPGAAIFIPVMAAGVWAAVARRARALMITCIAGVWLFSGFGFFWVAPQIDAACSGRALSAEMVAAHKAGIKVATAGVQRGILNFYAGFNTASIDISEVAAFLREPERVVVMQEKPFRRTPGLAGQFPAPATFFVADRNYVLLRSPR